MPLTLRHKQASGIRESVRTGSVGTHTVAERQRDIHNGCAMSRAPRTYAGWAEEDRRQAFLPMLNSHYACQTYAEAFTASRQTDLLLRVEDRDLFRAECLTFEGAKELTKKREQLFGSATCADVRLALIPFVPGRAFSSVIRAGREAFEQHPEFPRVG